MPTRLFGVIAAGLLLTSCTGPLTPETLADKPTAYLCRLLGPDYITTPKEQEALYRELERRGATCGQPSNLSPDKIIIIN